MNLKTHLIIIICISLAIYGAWYFMQRNIAVEPVQTEDAANKDHFIQIARASYGLNCLNSQYTNPQSTDPFQNSNQTNVLAPDNALSALSTLCNGKETCSLKVGVKEIGFDPSPQCVDKTLEIEYRCFSYDRPWIVTGRQGDTVSIDCSKR